MGIVALKCPGCGSNIELDDSREFGFCNFCGTKVMQDKVVVEHHGSVKMDNSEFVEKYLLNARRAKLKGDWAEVEKYYNLVEQNAPTNIEAIFYSAYGKLRCTLLENYSAKWDNDVEVVKRSISVLDDYFDISKEEEQKKIIIEAMNDILILTDVKANNVIVGRAQTQYGDVAKTGIKNRIVKLYPQMNETIDNIIIKYKQANLDYSYLTEIKNKISQSPKNGCYVATSVYGSYDCPQVWTLRRYRDIRLSSTWYGRAFICTYYAISPTIVRKLGNTQWFKNIWRKKLDRMVIRLKSEGFEDTPYDDIKW